MEKNIIIDITVSPKSSKSLIKINEDKSIKVYLNSPPVDGKANAECIKLFSKKLKIAKSNIKIIKGDKGKHKTIQFYGITRDEFYSKIN